MTATLTQIMLVPLVVLLLLLFTLHAWGQVVVQGTNIKTAFHGVPLLDVSDLKSEAWSENKKKDDSWGLVYSKPTMPATQPLVLLARFAALFLCAGHDWYCNILTISIKSKCFGALLPSLLRPLLTRQRLGIFLPRHIGFVVYP